MTFVDKDGNVLSHTGWYSEADKRNKQADMERKGAKQMQQERAKIDAKLAPISCFTRGIHVGALTVGAVNTMIPGQFGVIDWPLWLRLLIGIVFLLLAVNYLLAQRGFMIAKRISRA